MRGVACVAMVLPAMALVVGCGAVGDRPPAPAPLPSLPTPRAPPPAVAPAAAAEPAAVLPLPAPSRDLSRADTCGLAGFREEVLRRVNAARAAARACGATPSRPAPPLAWSDALFTAAASHSRAMAAGDYVEHVDAQGRRPSARVTAAGYRWRDVGENIAAGDGNVEQVVAGWLRSEAHCRNIMEPGFEHIGVACTERPGTRWHTYWTMVLAKPR